MALAPWNVQGDDSIDEGLRRCKADKAVRNACHRVVQDLIYSDYPAAMGVPKKGKCLGCFGTHVRKSAVLLCRVDYTARRIDLADMGDHKAVYGRGGPGGPGTLGRVRPAESPTRRFRHPVQAAARLPGARAPDARPVLPRRGARRKRRIPDAPRPPRRPARARPAPGGPRMQQDAAPPRCASRMVRSPDKRQTFHARRPGPERPTGGRRPLRTARSAAAAPPRTMKKWARCPGFT